MNLTSPSQVKAWCIENGFHPNKTLGQNFLIDRNVLCAIVDAGLAGVPAGSSVLEIGPGLGVLTEELLARGSSVTAVEKDPVLAGRLPAALAASSPPERLRVIAGDALAVIAGAGFASESYAAMVSNLPYQAGTRILLELVRMRRIPRMTVLVQLEVAERLAASEGSKVRGLAGVWAQLDYDVQIVRKVPASCFWPRPAIGSAVAVLSRHNRNIELSDEERRVFAALTKTAFAHRRKQLGTIFKDLIQSTARAEELSNEDWINLAKGLVKNADTRSVFE